MLEKRAFYIGGEWRKPAVSNDFPVIDPSTEEPCAVISLGGEADTEAAVAAARSAFDAWSVTSKSERLALVERILEIYGRRAQEMAQAISLEMGSPIDAARTAQVGAGAANIKAFIHAFKDFELERPFSADAPNDRLLFEPVGVCGLITPWNWPMNQVTLKVIPALLAGCTMVLKPSEIAPLSSLLFAEFVDEAGTPPGVFNLVNGDGAGVGTQLARHPDVDLISLTGSGRAGIAVSKVAAETLKRVSLELGGKGANIIFPDAPEKAVSQGAMSCFFNSGQSCNAPTRMLVQRGIYEDAVATAAEFARALPVGPASKKGRHIGPLVSGAQFDKVQHLIQAGIDEGARLVAGGTGRPDGLERGYFTKPSVFADVSNQMTIAREEIFGPVLSIIPFETEEEAVEIANDTPYGLTNYVQSEDGERRNRIARRLRSGMVQMNGRSRAAGSPFGGMKASGHGREGGRFGLMEYLEVKSVSGWHDG